MAISTRAALAMGLGLLSAAGLVSATYGQQGDGSVRKTAGNGAATAASSCPGSLVSEGHDRHDRPRGGDAGL